MAQQLSELVAMFRKQRAPRHTGVRKGFARGSQPSTGAKAFKRRNSQAGLQKDTEVMQSPIFSAFIDQLSPRTPITDFLREGRK